MGRWKAIVPIGMAVVIALSLSIFLYRWVQTQKALKDTVVLKVESETVPIAVAAIDIAWGTKLASDKLKLEPFLKKTLPAGHFTDMGLLDGRVLITPVRQNEPILESRLAPINVATGGVSAIVKPGKRALAVKGDKVIGLSGFIHPGNRVDVLVTLEDPRTKREVTKIVLQDILVLATGTEIQENNRGKAAPVDVYTLEVAPEEGEKLALAATQGKLQLALRNPMDVETVLTKGATIPHTLASFYAAKPRVVAKKKRNPKPVARKTKVKQTVVEPVLTVQEIRGTNIRYQKFNK